MTVHLIHLLHVEDDLFQRRFVAQHLTSMSEYHFDVRYAEDEDGALSEFQSSSVDLVLLDYHLTHGDGLSCLKRIRRLDGLVPIIAISGMASHEIAAELLQVGADDFIDKSELTGRRLAENLIRLLARTAACRDRISKIRVDEN